MAERDERSEPVRAPNVSGKLVLLVFVGLTVLFAAVLWWASKAVRKSDQRTRPASPPPSASAPSFGPSSPAPSAPPGP